MAPRPARPARLACACALVACAGGARGAPFFHGLGDFDGGSFYSRAYAISADGLVVVGEGVGDAGNAPFIWRATTGMVPITIDVPEAISYFRPAAVSADGSAVVGSAGIAVRWTPTSSASLGLLAGAPFPTSRAWAVSANGLIVVGDSASMDGFQAFRWVATGGGPMGVMTGLGDLDGGIFLSRVVGVSADGSIAVGSGQSANGLEAMYWTSATGLVPMGDLNGGSFSSTANAISADGSVIVGRGSAASGDVAFRWTAQGGMAPLGTLSSPMPLSRASAVSRDGSVIIGQSNEGTTLVPFVWDSAHGMRSLRGILVSELGLDLTGWTLDTATGVSGDGMTIVGYGINPSGDNEAWIARIDPPLACPGDIDGDGVVNSVDLSLLLGAWGTNSGAPDLNGDGVVNAGDLAALLGSWGVCAGPRASIR